MNKNIPLFTAGQLVQHQRNIPSLFAIKLSEQKECLECRQIFRLLPKRRLVCLATQNNLAILVKLFIHPQKAKTDYQKELNGYNKLNQTKLLIPKRLEHGCWEENTFYIIYEYLANTISLSQALKHKQYANGLIQQMLGSIAIMHQANLQQIDLHLDNFLLQDNKLFCIDFGEINALESLPNRTKNLADILSQFPIAQDTHLAERLNYYNHQLSDSTAISLREIQQSINSWRGWRIKKYLQKAGRNCSEFIKKQSWNEYMVVRREYDGPEWQRFCAQLDTLMESAERLKDGNTATVCLLPFNNQQLVVKRYNIKNFKHLLSRFWRPSRAWNSWQNAHCLAVLGISTPKPIAVIEKRFGGFRHKAYFITEYNANPDALSIYNKKHIFTSEQIEAFKSLFDSLAKAQISHGDMKGNNLLLDDEKIALIDLDAMKQHGNYNNFYKAHLKDIRRFLQNWQNDSELLGKLKSIFNLPS